MVRENDLLMSREVQVLISDAASLRITATKLQFDTFRVNIKSRAASASAEAKTEDPKIQIKATDNEEALGWLGNVLLLIVSQ